MNVIGAVQGIEETTLPKLDAATWSDWDARSQVPRKSPFSLNLLTGLLVLLCLTVIVSPGCSSSAEKRVVLYCAQDQEFAEASLADFTKQTNLPVNPTFDTEAGKSTELYLMLLDDKNRPRCDVFWNNEIINTIRLQRQGLLQSYDSPSAAAYPASCRAADHTWTAFATRARILIVNKQLVKPDEMPKSLLDLTQPHWKGRLAIAKPQFGTSATMAASLFQVLGVERAKEFYRGLKANGVQVLDGNKDVAVAVGEGRAAVGVTDTDDALEEIRDGKPVAIVFPDRDAADDSAMGTLFMPNTLCILRDCPNLEGARRLVDYLLSPEVEKRLAEESPGHQIPLNPNVKASLPPQLETPKTVKAMKVDFEKAVDLLPEVQEFIQHEFAR